MSIDWEALRAPFAPADVEWRIVDAGRSGAGFWAKIVAYATNRGIMARLDEVVGPPNWKNEFMPGPSGGVLCGLSIFVDDEWVTKFDGAENTDIEGVKGGLSGSMKRAAVQWGIARYLYDLDTQWAEIVDEGKGGAYYSVSEKRGGGSFYWVPSRAAMQSLMARQPGKSTKPTGNPAPPSEPAGKPNGRAGKPSSPPGKPGDESSSMSKALASVKHAPDLKVWKRYKAAIEKRIEQGEWTAEEVKLLEAAIALRGGELGAEPEPEGVDEPAEKKPDPDDVRYNLVASLAVTYGCPEEKRDEWIKLALLHDDPGEYLKAAPWVKKTKKQGELV